MKAVSVGARAAWPGLDLTESLNTISGELGAENWVPFPVLTGRGVGSDSVGRTALFLEGLGADLQPHGWRVTTATSRDFNRAQSTMTRDVQALADFAGSTQQRINHLTLELLGPVSLAASLYLANGERALSDHGARRDLAESLAAGIGEHVAAVKRAVPGVVLAAYLSEPQAAAARAGAIPTQSGYRTLRSVPAAEIRQAWSLLVRALHEAGVSEVVLDADHDDALVALGAEAEVDAYALSLNGRSVRDWEGLAAIVEDGRKLWIAAVPSQATAGGPLRTEESARPTVGKRGASAAQRAATILTPWREVGLAVDSLGSLTVLPQGPLDLLTPPQATRALSASVDLADALNQAMVS